MLYGDWEGASMTYEEKRATIEKLLDHWDDYFEKATSGSVTVKEESGKQQLLRDVSICSSMSRHPAVIELSRVLADLRKLMPRRYALLVGFYESDSRLVNRPIKRKDAKGRWVDDVERVRERVLNRRLQAEMLENTRCRERGCPCGNALPGIVCRAIDDLLTLWRTPCQDPPRRSCQCKWCVVAVPLELPQALTLTLREFVDGDGTHLTEAA